MLNFQQIELIVKPIPVRTETAYRAIQFELFGFCARFNFTEYSKLKIHLFVFQKINHIKFQAEQV